MMRIASRLISSLLLLFVFSVISVVGFSSQSLFPRMIGVARADISLAQAVEQVKQMTGGRVLSSKEVNTAAGSMFLIKVLLPSGEIKTYRVSAADGSIQ